MLRVAVSVLLCGQASGEVSSSPPAAADEKSAHQAVHGQKSELYELAFDEFVHKYNKSYATDDERSDRFAAFKDNYDRIVAHNGSSHSYAIGMSPFADLTPDEFVEGYTSQPWVLPHMETMMALEPLLRASPDMAQLPESVDWRTSGAVTDPKNQGQCGSCWAFATTGALEGRWKIKTGHLISLSEQHFLNCASDGDGCQGGNPGEALRWAQSHALCTENSVKYEAKEGKCPADDGCKVAIPRGGVRDVVRVHVSDADMMEAVSQGPVAIGLAAGIKLQLYSGGVFHESCTTDLNHGVLAVGYGKSDRKYWQVKNSWGASWGESGYFRIARGPQGPSCAGLSDKACEASSYCSKTSGQCSYVGDCGLLLLGYYPVMASVGQHEEFVI